MSSVNFLEKLLDGVEVEWKALKDIGTYVRGLVYNKSSESSDGKGYKVLRANNITLSENSLNFDDVKIVNFDTKVKKDQKLRCNDILISAASGSREHVGKVAFIEKDIDYYFGGFMGVIRCNASMIPRYAFHVLTSQHFKIYLDEMLNSSTINNLNSAVMGNFKFPIPCPDNPKKSLEIQAEIVRILDAMTAHTAELTAELTARKKQYNYYRDKLLSFDEENTTFKKLGDLTTDKFWIMPATPNFDENEKIPYITSKNISGGLIDFNKVKFISQEDYNKITKNRPILEGDFLISMIGTIGEVGIVKSTDLPFYGQNMYLIRLNDTLIDKGYFLHFFDSPKMKKYFHSIKNNSGQGYLKANNIEEISIPLPPLLEQKRISNLLDKFGGFKSELQHLQLLRSADVCKSFAIQPTPTRRSPHHRQLATAAL